MISEKDRKEQLKAIKKENARRYREYNRNKNKKVAKNANPLQSLMSSVDDLQKQIGEENAQYLNNLSLSYDFLLSGLKVRLIHASPNSIYESINYYDIEESLNDSIKAMFKFGDGYNPDIVIFGHIHSPFVYRLDKKMLLNPGSVSNGCDIVKDEKNTYNLSSYMILEGNLNSKQKGVISYEIVKIPYDYIKEVENFKNSDMPNKKFAINELETGVYKKR